MIVFNLLLGNTYFIVLKREATELIGLQMIDNYFSWLILNYLFGRTFRNISLMIVKISSSESPFQMIFIVVPLNKKITSTPQKKSMKFYCFPPNLNYIIFQLQVFFLIKLHSIIKDYKTNLSTAEFWEGYKSCSGHIRYLYFNFFLEKTNATLLLLKLRRKSIILAYWHEYCIHLLV